jgi:hypothetical protein
MAIARNMHITGKKPSLYTRLSACIVAELDEELDEELEQVNLMVSRRLTPP